MHRRCFFDQGVLRRGDSDAAPNIDLFLVTKHSIHRRESLRGLFRGVRESL